MACRRCLNTFTRHNSSLRFSNIQRLHPAKTLLSSSSSSSSSSHFNRISPVSHHHFHFSRNFASGHKNSANPKIINQQQQQQHDEEEEDDDDDEDEFSEDDSDGDIDANVGDDEPHGFVNRAYSIEDKIEEAAYIGYKVVGPLKPDDRVFKPYESVFAVVQIGSHQFKVSNGDCIYAEKLKFCDINDKLILNKVLMVGSPTQTIIGRPILPDAAVHAVVEEHALDAKVIIFKKKRRKNYRRTKGHRQELTRLRITDIQGIEKPEIPSTDKTSKKSPKEKSAKVAVAA